MTPLIKPAPHLSRFLHLSSVELILAGAWTLFVAISQNLRITAMLAAAAALIGVVCLIAPTVLKNHESSIVSALRGRLGQLGALAIPAALSAFLFLRNPGFDALKIIAPILACLWLIGVEALFFFHTPNESVPERETSQRFAFPALVLCYGILLIPSRIPSILDGIPWNTPLEFAAATLILPFGFFFGRRFLSSKGVTLLLALLLVVKITLSLFLPQSGLGVRVYLSEEALASGRHERTYESFFNPSYSHVAQSPYQTFHEFPIESINRHGFDKESFWMTIQLDGVLILDADERFVLIVQGAAERNVQLADLATGTTFEVATVKSADDLSPQLFDEIPQMAAAELRGTLVFPNYGNARFEPTILRADGSARPAFSDLWLSASAVHAPVGVFQFLQNLIALIVLGLAAVALLDGVLASYRSGILDGADFYLAMTGFILYYVSDVSDKPGIDSFFFIAALVLIAIQALGLFLRPQAHPGRGWLISIGLPVLLMFLPLDIHNLRAMTPIPQFQDAMEYQMLARNIYVAGDAFLIQSPPWAYKVLFPYIVGLLHILFGQSLSAQFFLHTWCALLSAAFMAKIGAHFGLTKESAFIAAGVFLVVLLLPLSFTYYFRFGLIEPSAILILLATAYYAKEGNFAAMFALGVIAGMLRLNYAGAIFISITFLAPACTGGLTQAWGTFVRWLRSSGRRIAVYLIAIPLPSLVVAYVYSRLHPGYALTHEMNAQTSLSSMLESLASVIVGSDREYFAFHLRTHPLDMALIALPILSGLLIALVSLVYRRGVFEKLDLRLSLFLLSMLPVYAVLKPIGYFPRYSWAFLPPALIVVALVLQFAFLRDNKTR